MHTQKGMHVSHDSKHFHNISEPLVKSQETPLGCAFNLKLIIHIFHNSTYIYIYIYTHTHTHTHILHKKKFWQRSEWFWAIGFHRRPSLLQENPGQRFCMSLFREPGVEGQLLHSPLPSPHPRETGVSYLLSLGHSGARQVRETSFLRPKYSVRVKSVKSIPTSIWVYIYWLQIYWFQIPGFTTSWQAARSTCTIRADNRCIWSTANIHGWWSVTMLLCILSSITKTNKQAQCQLCSLPRSYVGPRFYRDFTLVWGGNVRNGNVLKTISDHCKCQGRHRCDERQINGNYREQVVRIPLDQGALWVPFKASDLLQGEVAGSSLWGGSPEAAPALQTQRGDTWGITLLQ